MRRLRLTALAVVAALPLAVTHSSPEDVLIDGSYLPRDSSCTICHPGPTKGLRASPHAFLLEDLLERGSCTPCHGDQREHAAAAQRAALEPLRPGAVTASACTTCHAGEDLAPGLAAHPWSVELRPRASTPALDPAVDLDALDPAEDRVLGLRWSALIAAGYRFLDVDGDRDRYRTDVNLDRGFRLLETELEGVGDGTAWADLVRFRASGIGDPYQKVEGLVEKDGAYRGRAAYDRSDILYRASGEFHRVDRKTGQTAFDVSFEPAAGLEVFASFTRLEQNGFWLTDRIGNQNLTPLTRVSPVASPRQTDSDHVEAGVAGTVAEIHFSASVEYLDDRTHDLWTYSQTSPINPAFNESENFRSQTSLRGPGARFSLARAFEGVQLEADGRVLDLDRRVAGSGAVTGFDISDFTTSTDSSSTGDSLTWLIDLTATVELTDQAVFLADIRWLDHEENVAIRQTDVTVFPTLLTQTTTTTNLDQHTSQRVFEGSVQVDVEPVESLTLTTGYAWSREQLRVPDLVAGDNDFVAGTIRDDGLLAGAQWRPDGHWLLEAGYRHSAQNGPQLHDIVLRDGRGVHGKVRYRTDGRWAEVFFREKQRENQLSSTRFESISTGLSAGLQVDEHVDVTASYVFTDIDSRTLTNFYFDPDPDPVPTFVGFDGATHTLIAGLGLRPSAAVHWRFDGSYTETSGSFDVRLVDWQTDFTVEVFEGGSAGVLVRGVDYEEAGVGDDYDALMTLIYWRQTLGRSPAPGS